ncbi:MAG TPA: hypothetical protein VE974_11700 [Thermoanaerobaculia bacterium]|nr:hypothetical protein [Thermoanaerobaculia bacterium]
MAPELQLPRAMENRRAEDWGSALIAGICGAVALTAVHQLARRVTDDAPRMDVLGERAIARTVRAAGGTLPMQPTLHRWALAGDLVANSAYYSLVACGRDTHMWTRAIAMGLVAGAGALVLPRRIGLGDAPKRDHLPNQIMTVAWYLVGGLAAACAGRALKGAAPAAA